MLKKAESVIRDAGGVQQLTPVQRAYIILAMARRDIHFDKEHK